jgi:hypothetical protein
MKELLRGESTISLEAAVLKCPNAELYVTVSENLSFKDYWFRVLTLKNYIFCPHCTYFFCIDLRTDKLLSHNIKCLVFITEMKSVYCAVRTGLLIKQSALGL